MTEPSHPADVNLYRVGIDLFNRASFYDAHEVLEDAWRASSPPRKLFLQGLVQVAVALHHHSTGNLVGACSVLARARRNLSSYPAEFSGIRLDLLLADLTSWQQALTHSAPLPPLPKIQTCEGTGC